MPPRVLILRAPGTNCDVETAFAFERAGGKAERVHVNRLLENPRLLAEFQVLCIPGGFCYGDDIAAGRILAAQMQHHLRDFIREFKDAGKLILGICNGFQALVRSGVLLPDAPDGAPAATLAWNASGKFEDRWIRLKTAPSPCVFFQGIETMVMPVAHGEGRFVTRDEATLVQLEAAGQLPLRYAPWDVAGVSRSERPATASPPLTKGGQGGLAGEQTSLRETPGTFVPYPDNPNGSQLDVAGVCDATGRVCGLMPHPERHIDPTQHPEWTRRKEQPEAGDGLAVFQNAVRYFQ
ncbi:MAG: phosphoribosylformylglycinamidine synthase subunit PurQ [Planctomycetia bacterium]|nr:phosphoribosylformylglycinamidine synthase subunit PurQ [Planctomycetia bacterium]